uniref:CUT domain-containing protein n=1 Tax=Steinernema glaseri TaxID=37863 RepID=A0A1I7YM80_9BILA
MTERLTASMEVLAMRLEALEARMDKKDKMMKNMQEVGIDMFERLLEYVDSKDCNKGDHDDNDDDDDDDDQDQNQNQDYENDDDSAHGSERRDGTYRKAEEPNRFPTAGQTSTEMPAGNSQSRIQGRELGIPAPLQPIMPLPLPPIDPSRRFTSRDRDLAMPAGNSQSQIQEPSEREDALRSLLGMERMHNENVRIFQRALGLPVLPPVEPWRRFTFRDRDLA